jgi:eukaryotic-like serine/threonine-protein kinase
MQQEQFLLPQGVTVRDPRGNRYVIEDVLGKGAFGAVYLVRDRESRDLFALKEVINPNKGDRERFAFEGEVLKRLHHRALPRVHSVFENDKLKRVYVLMDYIEGPNLEVLRGQQPGKRFPLPHVLALMAPIADALMYLHTQAPPIVHRDIKPANIIVPAGVAAVLADFGSAKEYVPGAGTTILSHRSPGYAAPEQYSSGTNHSTDMYGLGATLYALVTGSAPIDAPSRVQQMLSAGVDPLKPANLLNPTVPRAVADDLGRAMAISSADRFETVEEFWRALVAHARQQGPDASPLDLSLQAIEGSGAESVRKAQFAPRPKKWGAFTIFAGLLVMQAIEIGFFSYLLGLTILLRCCLGVLLLSLAALLYDLSSRARKSQKKLEAVEGNKPE